MGSINPVVVLPGKLTSAFADGLHASATVGVGQFCTNPGLVITVGDSSEFRDAYAAKMGTTPAGTMLTDSIAANFVLGTEKLIAAAGLLVRAEGGAAFEVSPSDFIHRRELHEEVFGPCTLIVSCADKAEAIRVIRSLEGQLTGSIHGSDPEIADAGDLVAELEEKVGRLIVNQFPTGLEVNSSVVHGGPFPATTDSRTTSVGGRAILRWARPVCYQNFPIELLPVELR
jgi:NADP-dependent aldehyde dehydrogenase